MQPSHRICSLSLGCSPVGWWKGSLFAKPISWTQRKREMLANAWRASTSACTRSKGVLFARATLFFYFNERGRKIYKLQSLFLIIHYVTSSFIEEGRFKCRRVPAVRWRIHANFYCTGIKSRPDTDRCTPPSRHRLLPVRLGLCLWYCRRLASRPR